MPTQARTAGARQFFSRGGTLSKWHPNYEFRPGQVEMAEAVESALAEKRHLIVEAGTGTGKTLAYLVPGAALRQAHRGFHRHQEPPGAAFLQGRSRSCSSTSRRPLKVCYMKGRNNYACRQKIYDAEKEPMLSGLEEVADFQIIREWEKTTEFGDRAEIKTLPEASTAWAKVDARTRSLHRPEVPAIRALLPHPDAPARARKRHHHRQSPPVLRRPLAARRELRGRHPPRIPRRGVRRSARDRGRGRPVLRRRGQQLPLPGAARATSRPSRRIKKFGTPELDRILERAGRARHAVLRACSARPSGASPSRAATPSARTTKRPTSSLLAAHRADRLAPAS